MRDPRFAEGVALYQNRQFDAAGRVFQELAAESPARLKGFFHAWVEVAAAFHHWARDNQAGARTLGRSAVRRFSRYAPRFGGIRLDAFVSQLDELFQWLKRHRLRYDPRLVPLPQWELGGEEGVSTPLVGARPRRAQ